MFIHIGIYKFHPQQIAFRNDYCMTCHAPQRAVQIETIDALHVCFVPMIPLGPWRRWYCCKCGMRPHQIHLTSWFLKMIALSCFLFATLFFWGVYLFIVPAIAEDPEVFWIFGVISPVGVVAMAAHLMVWEPIKPGYKELLESVPPADDTVCPLCDTLMIDEYFECHCPSCGVRRL